MTKKHTHEFRQKFIYHNGQKKLIEKGYYCIYCLMEVKNKEELEKL